MQSYRTRLKKNNNKPHKPRIECERG